MDNFIQYLCYFCDVIVELNHSVEVSSEYWSCQFCSEFICALVQGSTIFSNNWDQLQNSRFQRGDVKQVSFLGPRGSGVTFDHQGYLVLSAFCMW